jgi:hypothetical protein
MDVPIKYSDAEAKALIAKKLTDKTLSQGEQRRLTDQYLSYSKEYAKGGAVTSYAGGGVTKGKKMATKKIVEGKETYASKSAMMKHEKKEPMKKEKAEEKMAKGGAVKKYAKGGMAKGKC